MSHRFFLRPQGYVPFIALVFFAFSPFLLQNPFYLNIFILTIFYAALGSAWNIIGGYGGQLSIGHAAFFGIGAYTSTLLYVQLGLSPWYGMFLGALLSTGVAAIVGYPSFRLRGPFFALSTIAFGEVLHLVALNWRSLTKGAEGISIQFKPAMSNMLFVNKLSYVYLILGFLFFILGVVLKIERSRFGYYLLALREDEDAARVIGVNTTRVKLLALMISAFFTSLGGTFYAQYYLLIDPYILFSIEFSFQLALVSIIGGVGTALGPIIGSLLLTPLGEFLRATLGGKHQGIHWIIYAAILLLVVRFIPQGIIEGMKKKYQYLLSLLPDFRFEKKDSSPKSDHEK
jgi:branched-chain amino acid transport system permease protein